MILSQKYTLYLYPKQNYYGEKLSPIIYEYLDFNDININDKELQNKYWLYEILFEQNERTENKKDVQITKIKTILKRVRLSEFLI